jgi:hypothetical protein
MTRHERSLTSRLRVGTTAAVGVALAIGLSACATPVAGPAQTVSPTATAGPTPSPTESARAADAAAIDGVQVGEPFDEQTTGIDGFTLVPGCEWVGTADRDGYTLVVQRPDSEPDGPVVLVQAASATDDNVSTGPQTAEGIGIGSTIPDARAAYPDAEVVPSLGDRRYLKVGDDGASALFFTYTEGQDVVWAVTATSLDAPPYEACA